MQSRDLTQSPTRERGAVLVASPAKAWPMHENRLVVDDRRRQRAAFGRKGGGERGRDRPIDEVA